LCTITDVATIQISKKEKKRKDSGRLKKPLINNNILNYFNLKKKRKRKGSRV
jgi:hypothetical protein